MPLDQKEFDTSRFTLLVLDDDKAGSEAMAHLLAADGYKTFIAGDAEVALRLIDEQSVDLVIADLVLPGIDGIDFLMAVKKRWPSVPVIMLTGFGTIEAAVEATRKGAYEFLTKPADTDKLAILVQKALERRTIELENIRLREQLYERHSFDNIIGGSKPMREIYDIITRIAPTDAGALITGESGTGKELIADAIHYNSRRREKPLLKINCAAISEGVLESELFGHEKGAFTGAVRRHKGIFEQADGGTIFLDEVSEIPLTTQVKLLRVLQDGVVRPVGGSSDIVTDTRTIAASNITLEDAVSEKKFREDLYYRLRVVTVHVPALRERVEDIPLLVDAFLKEFNEKNHLNVKGLEDDVMVILRSYSWPGNVRELRNVIESMAVMARGDILTPVDIPAPLKKSLERDADRGIKAGMAMTDAEKYMIEETLKATDGNRTRAAKMLDIGLRTLQRKIKEYEINL